jgi:hypothetical protein
MEAGMTTRKSLSSRRGLGGFAALVGGAAMIVSVFLPWFKAGGPSYSGWDAVVEDVTNIGGTGDFFVNPAFASSGFSPFFTGLSVLIAGVLLVLIGLAMLASLRGGAFHLPGIVQVLLGVLALGIAFVGVANLASLYATGDTDIFKPEYGIFILTAGAVVGLLGAWLGIGGEES